MSLPVVTLVSQKARSRPSGEESTSMALRKCPWPRRSSPVSQGHPEVVLRFGIGLELVASSAQLIPAGRSS